MNLYDIAEQELAEQWPVGTRVQYVGGYHAAHGITGTVTGHSPGFDEHLERHSDYDSVHIKLDGPPADWPYKSGMMAPCVNDIKLVETKS